MIIILLSLSLSLSELVFSCLFWSILVFHSTFGLLTSKAFAATKEIQDLPLGSVIVVAGQRFTKITADGQFMLTCASDEIFSPTLQRCIKEFGCSNPTDTMQHWSGCAALATPTGSNYTQGPCLADARDGKTYQIRKFADGKCWMVTNLAYGGADKNGGVDACLKTTFSGTGTNTTNNPSNIFGPGTYGDCRYLYDSITTPDTNHYGYAYDAVAYTQDPLNYNSSDTYQPSEPRQGICPDGWRLPMGGETTGDYMRLRSLAGGGTFWRDSNGFAGVLSGSALVNNGGIKNPGTFAWYSTSTKRAVNGGGTGMWTINITANGVNRGWISNVDGGTIRCLQE